MMSTITNILALLTVLMFGLALVGLIRPSTLKLTSRVKAFASFLSGSFILLLLTGYMQSTQENLDNNDHTEATSIATNEITIDKSPADSTTVAVEKEKPSQNISVATEESENPFELYIAKKESLIGLTFDQITKDFDPPLLFEDNQPANYKLGDPPRKWFEADQLSISISGGAQQVVSTGILITFKKNVADRNPMIIDILAQYLKNISPQDENIDLNWALNAFARVKAKDFGDTLEAHRLGNDVLTVYYSQNWGTKDEYFAISIKSKSAHEKYLLGQQCIKQAQAEQYRDIVACGGEEGCTKRIQENDYFQTCGND